MELDDNTGFAMGRRPIWEASLPKQNFAALAAEIDVDVAIIGGGITGITTAALLASSNLRIAVLEAAQVGSGSTGHSTGNLYATVDQHLHKLSAKWGELKTRQVVDSRLRAIDVIENLTRTLGLKCGFSRQPWTLYSMQADASMDAVIENEYQAATRFGLRARLGIDLPLPYPVHKALVVSNQAQFHPLAYVRQLAAAIRSPRCEVYEMSPVTDIDEDTGLIKTLQGRVHAQHIVMATHTPLGISLLHTELGVYREYAVAAPLLEPQLGGGIFWSAGPEKHSTRLVEHEGMPHVLIIGEKHKTGQKEDAQAAYLKLEAILRRSFKIGDIAYRWSAQQYRPADGMPYIGKNGDKSRIYHATGFAADGLTYGTVAAMVIADEVTGVANDYAELYTPRRFNPMKAAPTFIKENLNIASYYVKDYLKHPEAKEISDVARGAGRIVEVAGDKLAVYRDDAHQLHVLSPVCTHMKCQVHFNQAERTWDCPCHGSRFSVEGTVIEGPALSGLKKVALPGETTAPGVNVPAGDTTQAGSAASGATVGGTTPDSGS
ncbi:FAD-dependent oxidoreductase [Noviherbaspirillum saxi]|uniref:FAD-dependent oxidoreductase n=1 Tax=Noviherbaspirillum saxi TaxID=2320863 RepID=A0A3A3FTH2_9BURK|nr:FAD-dependent oxidoreductase [Noviherbaspirillum saxi]RJF99093.1 FAD-dependent oxidoreductase [Noviherbaspirillum saxi]